jgi:PAS domain-containing protein
MSSIELLSALQAELVTVPVIILDAHNSEMIPLEAVRLGVRDFLSTPVTADEVLSATERVLVGTRIQRERDHFENRLSANELELTRRTRELDTLFGTGKSITSFFEERRLLARLVEAAVYLSSSETGSLFLLDESGTDLFIAAARGINERFVQSIRLSVKDSLAGEVFTSGQPAILSGEALEVPALPYLVNALIYVPLKIKDKVHGVLGVDIQHERRQFTNHELRLLSTLADYAALWLENVQLANRLEVEKLKLSTLLAEIDRPIVIVTGQDYRIVSANAAFEAAFGTKGEIISGTRLENLDSTVSLLEFLAGTDTGHQVDGVITGGDGHTFVVSVIPVPDVGLAVILRECVHFKEPDRSKAEVFSRVSHELRLPLDLTNNYLDGLKRVGPLPARQ